MNQTAGGWALTSSTVARQALFRRIALKHGLTVNQELPCCAATSSELSTSAVLPPSARDGRLSDTLYEAESRTEHYRQGYAWGWGGVGCVCACVGCACGGVRVFCVCAAL